MSKKRKNEISFDFDLMQSASESECTGIMPRPPQNDSEYEAYQEVFDFGPPKIRKKRSKK